MSTVIVFANHHDGYSGFTHRIVVSLAVLIVALALYLLLRFSSVVGRVFTDTVNNVVSRVMGLVLVAIAVEFMLHGLAGHFPGLGIVH